MKQRAKILIVEDSALVASDIQECLESLGYDICGVAPSGEQALQLCETAKPNLVLMDIILEGEMDGIEAARRIRQDFRTPVVYLTAHADERTLKRAKITEPYGYILKPFEEAEVRTALELALYRHKSDAIREQTHGTSGSELAKRITENFQTSNSADAADTELFDFLVQMPPFKHLDQAAVRAIAAISKKQSYCAGDYLAFEGDQDVPGFIVMSGRVALAKSSSSGRDLVVELLVPGDPLGLLITTGEAPYPVTAEARVESTLVIIPRAAVLMMLDGLPDMGRELIEQVFSRLRESHNASRGLAHDRVEVRVASALLTLRTRLSKSEDGEPEDSIPLTRQELADLTGSTPETVTRVCKIFERDNLVALPKSGMIQILSKDGLEQLLAEI